MKDLLVALATVELESEHAAQLQAHLTECAECQAEFAGVSRIGELAKALKLNSPEIDRYPEFLRRLVASEIQAPREGRLVALGAADGEIKPLDDASVSAKAGMAAVIPLFGNRIAVRNGFGQGFDLSITSSRGSQWLHLSAKSLTRVAAVAAGVSLAAGISVVALLLFLFSFRNRPQQEPQTPLRVEGQLPNLPPRRADDALWIQTASTADLTLAIWRENAQLQAGWIKQGSRSLSNRFPLNAPDFGNRPPLPPRVIECSLATDGKNFVVLREVSGAIYLWHLAAQDSASEKTHASATPPIMISRKGAQPDVAWTGDRYVAVWVVPDLVSPVLEMIELGSDGRPLQTSATVVAETGQGGKVGLPGVTGGSGKVLISYFVQGGALLARTFIKADDAYKALEPVEVSIGEGMHQMPIRLLTLPDGYLACWDAMKPEGAEIRLARLDQQGRPRIVTSLARARTPITSFDLKLFENGNATLLWSEVQPGGALTFTQPFSLDGKPLEQPRNVFVADSRPSAVVFGDAEGKSVLWPEMVFTDKFPIGITPIGTP